MSVVSSAICGTAIAPLMIGTTFAQNNPNQPLIHSSNALGDQQRLYRSVLEAEQHVRCLSRDQLRRFDVPLDKITATMPKELLDADRDCLTRRASGTNKEIEQYTQQWDQLLHEQQRMHCLPEERVVQYYRNLIGETLKYRPPAAEVFFAQSSNFENAEKECLANIERQRQAQETAAKLKNEQQARLNQERKRAEIENNQKYITGDRPTKMCSDSDVIQKEQELLQNHFNDDKILVSGGAPITATVYGGKNTNEDDVYRCFVTVKLSLLQEFTQRSGGISRTFRLEMLDNERSFYLTLEN